MPGRQAFHPGIRRDMASWAKTGMALSAEHTTYVLGTDFHAAAFRWAAD
jgi:hypothetical protein